MGWKPTWTTSGFALLPQPLDGGTIRGDGARAATRAPRIARALPSPVRPDGARLGSADVWCDGGTRDAVVAGLSGVVGARHYPPVTDDVFPQTFVMPVSYPSGTIGATTLSLPSLPPMQNAYVDRLARASPACSPLSTYPLVAPATGRRIQSCAPTTSRCSRTIDRRASPPRARSCGEAEPSRARLVSVR